MMDRGIGNGIASPIDEVDNAPVDYDEFVRDFNARLRQSGRESRFGGVAPVDDHQV